MQELDYSNLVSHDTFGSGYDDIYVEYEQQNEPE